ncbi:hypothetical protein [Pontibacter sp. G13]|uniref:hypothetical protein n=1 Tax=Pontibacter sp. G13 TaxID=3074898 RepID=UPI00288A1BC4|nr:hypothetical protein [Pontibacter sp. G13]WNJ19512.1 hypothetical protein RJD25_03375 [Pontibacter sp. G13]
MNLTRIGCVLCLLFGGMSWAQQAMDQLTKTNGETIEVEVTAVSPHSIEYHYPNEHATYSILKSDVATIRFANGRTQNFEAAPAPPPVVANRDPKISGEFHANVPIDQNLAAILPFKYWDEGNLNADLGKRAQSAAYRYALDHPDKFSCKFQDPNSTNSLLAKNGIELGNLDQYSATDLAHLLGVGYVVMGTVTRDKKSVSSSTSTFGSEESEQTRVKNKTDYYSGGTTTTTRQFQNTVDLSILDASGQTLYTDSRTAFWDNQDSYQDAIRHMMKKSPIHQK